MVWLWNVGEAADQLSAGFACPATGASRRTAAAASTAVVSLFVMTRDTSHVGAGLVPTAMSLSLFNKPRSYFSRAYDRTHLPPLTISRQAW